MSNLMKMVNCTSSHGLLQEMKNKDRSSQFWVHQNKACIQVMEQQRQRLQDRIEAVTSRGAASSGLYEKEHLMGQLVQVEGNIRRMSQDQFAKEDQVGHGSEADQWQRFFFAVADLLRRSEGRRCRIKNLLDDQKLAGRWKELQRSRLIRKAAVILQVIKDHDKDKEFEIVVDSEGQQVVRFAGELDSVRAAAVSHALQSQMVFPMALANASDPFGALRGLSVATQQMNALGAQATGVLQLQNPGVPAGSQLAMLPGPQIAMGQLASWSPGQPMPAMFPGQVVLGANTADQFVLKKEEIAAVEAELAKSGGSERLRKLCLHLNVTEQKVGTHFKIYEDNGKSYVTHQMSEVFELERTLENLAPRRGMICEAMVFCLEHAFPTPRGTALAKALVRSLHVPELESEAIIARLFLVSDVLSNARAHIQGASRYRMVFEEYLPDAFEFLGRQWLRGAETDKLSRARAEAVLKKMFNAWRNWDAFPTVFIGGLEALLLGPAPEDASECVNDILRQKLTEWCEPTKAADLPMAARRRGLCGKDHPVTSCRQRLCVYERYWHSALLEGRMQSGADLNELDCAMEDDDDDNSSIDGTPMSIDGEPLDREDLVHCGLDGETVKDFSAYVDNEPDTTVKVTLAVTMDPYTTGDSSEGIFNEIEACD